MILSGHQPGYLPGLQLFNKIMLSDAFMYVPHCQYQAKSWHSHNYIRTGKLIVPVHSTLGDAICDVKINYSTPWRRKTLRSIEMAYGRSPYFGDFFPDIKFVIENQWASLATLNMNLMDYLMGWLNCDKFSKCIYSSLNRGRRGWPKDPIQMIIDMCRSVDCDTYLSNKGAEAYIGPAEEARMAAQGITHLWQDWQDPDYGQPRIVNDGRLSVLDALFTLGPKAYSTIFGAGAVAQ